MSVHESIALAPQLDPPDRSDMVSILESSLLPPDPEFENLWADEALRRLAALDSGRGQTRAMQEVFGKNDAAGS